MPPKPKGEYIETDTGNRVSRKSQIHGTQNIILGGKTVIQAEVCIRGDLKRTLPPTSSGSGLQASDAKASAPSNVAVAVGKYCIFSQGCLLRPPSKPYRGVHSYYPLKIGDHVFIGPHAIVEAAMIGSYVHIGEKAIIGKFAIIKEYVRVLPGTVLPPNSVIPPFSIVAGVPGRVVAELGEAATDDLDCRELYRTYGIAS